MNRIGITERADPTVNTKWQPWVYKGKPAILITKMPRILLPLLTGKENIIIHCTITGLGGTLIEPNIDPTDTSLGYYHKFCNTFGKDRVILRIDPIVHWKDFTYELKRIASEAEGRLRISFVDQYPHVSMRFLDAGSIPPQHTFHKPLGERLMIWEELGKPEVCAEPGLPSTPCVSEIDCKILGVKPSRSLKGQRLECKCLANKFELCTWPPKCSYRCLYCYWMLSE